MLPVPRALLSPHTWSWESPELAVPGASCAVGRRLRSSCSLKWMLLMRGGASAPLFSATPPVPVPWPLVPQVRLPASSWFIPSLCQTHLILLLPLPAPGGRLAGQGRPRRALGEWKWWWLWLTAESEACAGRASQKVSGRETTATARIRDSECGLCGKGH